MENQPQRESIHDSIKKDREMRDKRADVFVKFLNQAQKIEAFHGKKFEDIFLNEENEREFVKNIKPEEFIELISGINGILRNKEKEDWELSENHVCLASGSLMYYNPPFPEDKEELLKKDVLEAAKKMNEDKRSIEDIALLLSASINFIHPFDDGNGRTGRAIYSIFAEKKENLKEKLSIALKPDGKARKDIANPNPIFLIRKVEGDFNKDFVGENDIKTNTYYYDYLANLFKKDIFDKTIDQNVQIFISNNFGDIANFSAAIHKFLIKQEDKGLRYNKFKDECFIKDIPGYESKRSMIKEESFFRFFNNDEWKKIIDIYRDIKKELTRKLIDTIVNPNKEEYKVKSFDKFDEKGERKEESVFEQYKNFIYKNDE